MRIILLQDIKALGRRGDIKNVADGYARNFLLPRGLAKPATPAAIQGLGKEKAKLEEELGQIKSELENIEKATANEPLIFQVKTGEKGEVFGSVSASEIREKLIGKYPKLGTAIEIGADHIRELGKREIEIKLDRGLEGKATIEVRPQQP